MSYYSYYEDLEDGELFSVTDFSSQDMVYRSITTDYAPAVYTKAFDASTPNASSYICQSAKSSSMVSANIKCPLVPFGMAKTNFILSMVHGTMVVKSIGDHLKSQMNYDFSFIENDFMWRGKYLCGSSCFELEISLYQDQPANNYVVSVRKISGCSAVSGCFNNFFNAMKVALSTGAVRAAPRKAFCIPTGVCLVKVSDEEFLKGILPVFRMAEHNNESREQCAKTLCDLSQKDAHYLELPAFRPQCVKLLESLVLDESDDVRQYAVMAVAAFAELPSYKEEFMCSSILSVLFSLVENCPDVQQAYETAQVRRTAARVLAVLSRTHPYTVRSELQQQHCDVASWLQRVSCLQDTRTRESALVVKSYLEEVSPNVSIASLSDNNIAMSLLSVHS